MLTENSKLLSDPKDSSDVWTDEKQPSKVDEFVAIAQRGNRVRKYAEASAESTPAGKVTSKISNVLGKVDSLATAAFPPAAAVTSPLSTVAGLANKAVVAGQAADMVQSGQASAMLPVGARSDDEDSF
jgi:hypothetical protein